MIKDGDKVIMRDWVRAGDIISGIKIHPFMLFCGAQEANVIEPGLIEINGFYYPEPALEVSENANS